MTRDKMVDGEHLWYFGT